MFLIIYLAGVFFMIMSVVMTIADSRVLYLSDALRFMALALASWAGLLFLLVEIIADHVEDKHGDTKIFDFRRNHKK